MNTKNLIVLLAIALIPAALAEYLPIAGEPTYCERYGISEWCDAFAFQELIDLGESMDYSENYINELAFKDSLRYDGPLEITTIEVTADLNITSKVYATYNIKNTGASDITVTLQTLQTPVGTIALEDGAIVSGDPLKEPWQSIFSPGQEKAISLSFSEPLYGAIFGYNVNLLIDSKIPDNHLADSGLFEFTLPENAIINKCLPAGYTTSSEGSRPVVTWQKMDFVPWTNPFNDLVCKWNVTEPVSDVPAISAPASSGDSTLLYVLLVAVVIACVVIFYQKRRQR